MRRGAFLWALVGCETGGAKVDESDVPVATTTGQGRTDSDTDTDIDTDGTGGAGGTTSEPFTLAVACVETANALRFDCTVDVTPAQPVALTFHRTDGLSATRTVSGPDALAQHVLHLYFMAPEQGYDIEVVATAHPDEPVTTSVTTGLVPPGVAAQMSMTGTSTIGLMGTNSPCSDIAAAVVFDTVTGDMVWYQMLDAGGTFGADDMVTFTEDHTILGESVGDVIEIDLLGNDLMRHEDLADAFGITADGLFGNFHHDIMKRNGVYYVMYQHSYGGVGFNEDILDDIIVFDGSGTEIIRWIARDELVIPADWGGDFLHNNTVFVDTDGDILLSFLAQDTVGRFDGDWLGPTFGDTEWLMQGSGDGEVGNTITVDWGAVSPGFSDQHSLIVRSDGRIGLLDNGNGRGLVFDLDAAAGTAVAVGAYPTHENDCGPQGTSQSTEAGNPIVACSGAWVREYDFVSGIIQWEAEVECSEGNAYAVRWYPLEGW
jgi:hypothetical protein